MHTRGPNGIGSEILENRVKIPRPKGAPEFNTEPVDLPILLLPLLKELR